MGRDVNRIFTGCRLLQMINGNHNFKNPSIVFLNDYAIPGGVVGDDILFVCWVNSYILYIIIRLLVNLELIYFPGIAVVVGAGCCPAFVLNQS